VATWCSRSSDFLLTPFSCLWLLTTDDKEETSENAVTAVLLPVHVYSVYPLLHKQKTKPSPCVQNNQSNNALISGKPRMSDTVCDNVGDIR